MSERCVDASVIVKLALKGERYRAKARRLVHESAREGINLIAPPFFISEVDTAIRKRVHDGKLSSVSVAPGATQLALMLRVPISSDNERVKAIMAALAAQ